MRDEPSTVGAWVRRAAEQLRSGPHAGRARADAELLMQHTLGRNKAYLLAHGDDPLETPASEAYAAAVRRRLSGEPIQYITGACEFYGLPFQVTPSVLIPRPETEILVERAIAVAAAYERARVVDVGTGSGAIAVAVASRLASAAVAAVDVSPEALEVARANAARNGVRVRFVEGDLLEGLGAAFDVVVSNPPYVATADRAGLDPEVRDHEPALALFAGADGLAVYRRLIPQAYDALADGGHILLEIGFGHAEAVSTLLLDAGFTQVERIIDLQGIERVLHGRRAAR